MALLKMKILKHDIDAKTWSYVLKCFVCKTEMEVVIDDIKYSGERGDWHDAGWENYNVICPECGIDLRIPPDDIHELIKCKIQKKNKK